MERGPLGLMTPVVRAAAIACGWALMAISFATVFEVVARKLNYSLKSIDELGGYILAASSAIGFSWALVTRAHMRITLVVNWLPRPARRLLDAVAMLSLAGMAVFCAWRGYAEFSTNFISGRPSNTPMQTPLWMPQAVFFAGLALFALCSTLAAIHAAWLLFVDSARLERLYGPQSLEEEVSAEVSDIDHRLAAKGDRS
jgi:TRAP-type C4-dicarboxylate transport system permease small subunit